MTEVVKIAVVRRNGTVVRLRHNLGIAFVTNYSG